MLIFQNMLFEKIVGFWVSKYANFSKLAYKYAIWQPWVGTVICAIYPFVPSKYLFIRIEAFLQSITRLTTTTAATTTRTTTTFKIVDCDARSENKHG